MPQSQIVLNTGIHRPALRVARGQPGMCVAAFGGMRNSFGSQSSPVFGMLGRAVLVVALGLPACGADYVDTGGYDAEYARPPVGVAAYPSYVYRGTTVYDADGQFYAQRDGHWVRYRHAPAEVARWHTDRERGRGRAEPQR
jgi:hypothetical protein